jgi:flagellin
VNGHTVTFNTGAATQGLRRPSPPRASGLGGINGKTLTFTSFNGGTNGTIKTLDQLNAVLGANNLTAALDAKGNRTTSRPRRWVRRPPAAPSAVPSPAR